MKKLFKIFFYNILILLFFFNILNWYIFYKSGNIPLKDTFSAYIEFLTRDISEENRIKEVINRDDYRKIENINSKKKPILIFGCSFAWGSGLDENNTLSYKLGKLTNRPIYNRGYSSFGIQHMLYQLSNSEFYNLVPRPEYIVYVYFDGHPQRITTPVSLAFAPSYTVFYKTVNKLQENKKVKSFELKKRTFLTDKIIFQHYMSNMLAWNVFCKYTKYNITKENLIIEYLKASKKEIEKHWKNSDDIKFIVLFYNKPFLHETLEKLNKMGFYTLSEDDFKIDVHEKMFHVSDTDDHPNGLAWDKILPVMINKFNM